MLAVLVWRPSGRWWVGRRLGAASTIGRPATLPSPRAMSIAAVGVCLVVVPQVGGPRTVVAGVAVGVVAFGVGQLRAARRRRTVRRQQADVLAALGLIAAELRAGALPVHVIGSIRESVPALAPAARAAELGGDVPAAMREAAAAPGCGLLRDLGGAWHVAERSGARLVDVIERLEQTARSDRDIAREVEAGVGPARATGRLMAVLPVIGLLLGSGVGGDPVAVLTGTWVGAGCLAAGAGLACAGVGWIERIATSVDVSP